MNNVLREVAQTSKKKNQRNDQSFKKSLQERRKKMVFNLKIRGLRKNAVLKKSGELQ